MRITQRKISALVVELFRHEFDDVGIAPFVLGMTALTLEFIDICQAAMKSAVFLHVCGDVLVTVHAQTGLTDTIGAVMAIAAGALQLGMGITDLARHQQGFNTRCRYDAYI